MLFRSGANAGLNAAREKLEPIKAMFPQITYSDLWVSRLVEPRGRRDGADFWDLRRLSLESSLFRRWEDLTSSGALAARMAASRTARPTGQLLPLLRCAAFADLVSFRRLPDGDKGSDHIRKIFYRMGFNDQEIGAFSFPPRRPGNR